jgi:GNAT superfamily N-acetyltransferase
MGTTQRRGDLRDRLRVRHEVVGRIHAADTKRVYRRHRLIERFSSVVLASHAAGGNGIRGMDGYRRRGHRKIEITTIENPADIRSCHAVMMELRPHLNDVESFVRQVLRQQERGFHLSAAVRDGEIVGLIGYRQQENLMYGQFVFVDDLVVKSDVRSGGVGARLLGVARTYAREMGCTYFVLDTGLHMALAQRFYYRQGLLAHAMGFSEKLVYSDGA